MIKINKIKTIFLLIILVTALILVLIENHFIESQSGNLKPAPCVLPMQLTGLGDNSDNIIDNPIADLARINPSAIRFYITVKNKRVVVCLFYGIATQTRT